ncbi:MAG TPA: thioredoxin domain-containing protein [Candidatus Binatus sp.]|uniref:thioredoxin domain-containing protein n=1 Tax=Candidatus Binatus sp. TaxID=2811406 RepID=UPI002F3FEAC4
MSTRTILALVAIVCIASARAGAAADTANALPAGSLKLSPSMYLREASSSAIRWQAWSPHTLALARSLNRPIMIDIGAVWCHWCHVMDATTYADPQVAAALNSQFVPVKVDTDERPDLDEYYQNAAAQLTGAGGWPLTCFTTPDGALFFAAGFLSPRPGSGPNGSGGENSSMLPLLKRISQVYATDRAGLEREAEATAAKLKSASSRNAPATGGLEGLRAQILAGLAASYDRESGGFASGAGPRFYDFPTLELALAHGFYGHPEFTAMALDTLKKIAAGGVFDQLGGGFHRYSTDVHWRVPHFEKLGYDNAMALHAYSDAYEASGDPDFARVAKSLVDYINRDLLDSSTHAFYSHQDADSFKGDDGSFYTWTVAEVKRALPADEARVALLFYGMQNAPALAPDGRIVLRRAMTPEQLAARLKIPVEAARQKIVIASDAMLAVRARRKTPPVDRAVMTDRNALMADAYLTASAALDDSSLQRTALADLDFIIAHLQAPDGSFFHVWSDSRAQVTGLAADQVYMLNALIDAYQFSSDEKYLAEARRLAAIIMKNFRADNSNLLMNHDAEDAGTVVEQSSASGQVFFDMPTPSVQATMAIATAKLALITGDDSYSKTASALMANAPAMAGAMLSNSVATVGLALEYSANGEATVAIVGPHGEARAAALWRMALANYRPGKIVMRIESARGAESMPAAARAMFESSAAKGVPLAFVCAGTACATPVATPAKLAQVIRRFGVKGADQTTVVNDGPASARLPM